MKFAVFTVMLPELKPEQAVNALAATGYDGIEWRVASIPSERRHELPSYWGNNFCTLEPTLEQARWAKRLCQSAKLEICNLGFYLGPDNVEQLEPAMQFAKEIGSPSLRVNPASYCGDYAAAFDKSLDFFHYVETMAKQYQLKALIETHHGLISSSASLTHRFVSHFDPEHVGVIYDPGNMVIEGYEHYKMGLQLLGPYLTHIHLKNAAYKKINGRWQYYWSAIDDGIVDMKALMNILLELKYEGWLVMEDFSGFRPALESIAYNLDYIKAIFAELKHEA